MRKMICCLLVMVACLAVAGRVESHDKRDAIIVSCETETIIAKDTTGNVWAFEGEGYEEGDEVTLIIFNNNTDSIIEDDIVEDVKTK